MGCVAPCSCNFLSNLFLPTGHCKVDQTEKGWFIQYIDRDPRVIARQKELERQKAKEKDDEERHAKYVRLNASAFKSS